MRVGSFICRLWENAEFKPLIAEAIDGIHSRHVNS